MTPEVRIESIRQVYNDGDHNAFTDLCQFKGHYYLTFRTCPGGHMLYTSSRILVLRSEDGGGWQQVHSFSVPERDVRDPHFVVFGDKLFVYSGTWLVNPDDPNDTDMNEQLGYGVWSTDGTTWSEPHAMDGTHGHYIWRGVAVSNDGDDAVYLCGRRLRDFEPVPNKADRKERTETWLLRSTDGLTWTPHSLLQPQHGDETAFVLEDDGSLLAISRSGNLPAQVCRTAPPFTEWSRTDLDRYIGGPMVARWGDRYLVGGRNRQDQDNPFTALYWLVDEQLEELAQLPSGGDNSYPGFVLLAPDHGLLSYYSSHEGVASIYLADLYLSGE